jgi:hypothetical protein
MIGRTGTATREEDREIMTTTTPTARWPQDKRTTTIKEMTVGIAGTTTTKMIREVTGNSGQGTRDITTSHPMIYSTDPATCIILILMGKEFQTTQWRTVEPSSNYMRQQDESKLKQGSRVRMSPRSSTKQHATAKSATSKWGRASTRAAKPGQPKWWRLYPIKRAHFCNDTTCAKIQ